MSDATLNGCLVIRGDLKLPYQGAFTAQLEVDADSAPTGTAVLLLLGRTFGGTVVADPEDGAQALSGDSGGLYRCRIVGGAGGLSKPIAPQEWPQGAAVSQVLAAILGAGGESQAADVDPTLLARVLPQWSITQGSVGGALGALVEYLASEGAAVVWRIRGDGLVWIGTPNPQAVSPPDYVVTDIAPEAGQASWDLNEASVDVDQVIDGLTIRQVVYAWTSGRLRALVTLAPGPVNGLYALFGMWARRLSLDYLRTVPGRIAAQNADPTVQFQADDSRYAPMRRVGIRLGLPDTSVSIVGGARAEVAWEGASPVGPVLQSFGDSKATQIKIGASAPLGPKPLVNKSQRDAEQVLHGAIRAAYNGLPVAAADLATAITLVNAIRVALLGLSTGAYTTYENGAARYLTTILEGG